MSKTEKFLMDAFAGESQANRKYMAFAAKAEQEGYLQVARLFRAAAEAEAVHAINHLLALKSIGSTKENLREALAGETHEFKEMYPVMIETARSEGDKLAERSFNFANEVEKVHAQLYHEMMENLEAMKGQNFPYFVCPVCGLTVARGAPAVCPVCGAKGKLFRPVE